MIDLPTGRVACGSLVLQPTIRAEELLALPGTQVAPSVAGSTHLALGLHHCEGQAWGIGAMFEHERLKIVVLQMLDDEPDWSLQHEERRQQAHDKFLEDLCVGLARDAGRVRYTFSWGAMESILDRRAVQAKIIVGYK